MKNSKGYQNRGDILIVDDELSSLRTLSDMFSAESYDVRGPCRLLGNWTRLVLALLTISCLLLFPLRSHADEKRSSVDLSPEEQSWLAEHPSIKLGFIPDLEPWAIQAEDGSLSGILIDIFKRLEDILGMQIEIEIAPWAETIDKARRREVDGTAFAVPAFARWLGMLQTIPYQTPYMVAFARRDRGITIEKLEDMEGLTITYQRGIKAITDLLEPISDKCTIIESQSLLEAFGMTQSGKSDVTVAFSTAPYILNKYLIFDIEPVHSFVDTPLPFAVTIRPDWPELVSILNKGFQAMEDGELERITAKWIGEPDPAARLALTATEKEWLAEHKNIRLGSLGGEMPLEFVDDDGNYSGVISDIVRRISENLGVSMEPQTGLSWKQMIGRLKSKELDVMTSIARSPEHEKHFLFTIPHTTAPHVLISHDEFRLINKIEDLGDDRFAIVSGYRINEKLKRDYPHLNYIDYDTFTEALKAVSQQKADVLMGVKAMAEYIQRAKSILNLRTAASTPYEARWCMAVRKDWPELIPILNKELEQINEQEKSLMLDKWMRFRVERQVDWTLMLSWGLGLVCVAGTVIAVFLYANRKLAAEVVQRKKAEGAAAAANRAKSEFLANMSHELRTPLNAILGTGQIMSRDKDFPDKYKENLGILAHSGEYLLSLVNDVLEISRIEAGRVTLTKSVFNLKNTLITIEEMTHLRTKKKGLELEVDYDPNLPENIRTDKAKLHQILNNLLDNAIKYTKKGVIIFRVHIVNSVRTGIQNSLILLINIA